MIMFENCNVIVVIDDERILTDIPDHTAVMTFRTSESGIAALKKIDELLGGRIEILFLDHDLGGDDTIIPVVDYLAEQAFSGNVLNIGEIHVHTANPVGAQRIMGTNLLRDNYKMTRVDLSGFTMP
jgi:hypothetical protein